MRELRASLSVAFPQYRESVEAVSQTIDSLEDTFQSVVSFVQKTTTQ
jgi:hypothetical protein